MYDGQHFTTGVGDVDEDAGEFNLYTPQAFGDTTARIRLKLDDITSLTVTNIKWAPRGRRLDPSDAGESKRVR